MPQLVIKNQVEVTLWRCTFLQLQEWRSGLDQGKGVPFPVIKLTG